MNVINEVIDTAKVGGISGLRANFELGDMSARILNIVIGLGFGLSIISIAYAMILYITSAGDPNKTQTAWNAFLWGVVAGMISISVLGLRRIILTALGVSEDAASGIITGKPNF